MTREVLGSGYYSFEMDGGTYLIPAKVRQWLVDDGEDQPELCLLVGAMVVNELQQDLSSHRRERYQHTFRLLAEGFWDGLTTTLPPSLEPRIVMNVRRRLGTVIPMVSEKHVEMGEKLLTVSAGNVVTFSGRVRRMLAGEQANADSMQSDQASLFDLGPEQASHHYEFGEPAYDNRKATRDRNSRKRNSRF